MLPAGIQQVNGKSNEHSKWIISLSINNFAKGGNCEIGYCPKGDNPLIFIYYFRKIYRN